MANTKIPQLLTRQEVADHLRVSLRSIYNYEKRGYLKATRIGGRVLYRVDQIDLNNFPQHQTS